MKKGIVIVIKEYASSKNTNNIIPRPPLAQGHLPLRQGGDGLAAIGAKNVYSLITFVVIIVSFFLSHCVLPIPAATRRPSFPPGRG